MLNCSLAWNDWNNNRFRVLKQSLSGQAGIYFPLSLIWICGGHFGEMSINFDWWDNYRSNCPEKVLKCPWHVGFEINGLISMQLCFNFCFRCPFILATDSSDLLSRSMQKAFQSIDVFKRKNNSNKRYANTFWRNVY